MSKSSNTYQVFVKDATILYGWTLLGSIKGISSSDLYDSQYLLFDNSFRRDALKLYSIMKVQPSFRAIQI